MKIPIVLFLVCLCSACATWKEGKKEKKVKSDRSTASAKKSPTRTKPPNVRTPETVKAYPVGRYTDPAYPDAMHERHTVYRREQSPDWNYLPDTPYALPIGPTTARSNPSSSYYVTADREQMTAQQRAYAEALLEQNRALKKRLEATPQNDDRVQMLEKEIDQLKRQLDATSAPALSAPTPAQPEPSAAEAWDDFSLVDPPLPQSDDASDPRSLALLNPNTP